MIFALLNHATWAQICPNPSGDMETACTGSFSSETQQSAVCSEDVKQNLEFQRGEFHKESCCDEVECPFPPTDGFSTMDSLMTACKDFCEFDKKVVVPVLIGSHTYGLALEDGASVCLDPKLLGGKQFDKDLLDRCNKDKDIMNNIQNTVSSFLQELRKFTYSVVAYRSTLLNASNTVTVKMQEPATLEIIRDATRSETTTEILNLYSNVLSDSASSAAKYSLTSSLGKLKVAMESLKSVMDTELDKFESFTEDCDASFPRSPTYLLDLCKVKGGDCVEDVEGEHTMCCCLENPIANMEGDSVSDTLYESTSTKRRLLQDSSSSSVIYRDVCAEAISESNTEVDTIKETVRQQGNQDMLAELCESLSKKYGGFYYENGECEKRSASTIARPYYALGILLQIVLFWQYFA